MLNPIPFENESFLESLWAFLNLDNFNFLPDIVYSLLWDLKNGRKLNQNYLLNNFLERKAVVLQLFDHNLAWYKHSKVTCVPFINAVGKKNLKFLLVPSSDLHIISISDLKEIIVFF